MIAGKTAIRRGQPLRYDSSVVSQQQIIAIVVIEISDSSEVPFVTQRVDGYRVVAVKSAVGVAEPISDRSVPIAEQHVIAPIAIEIARTENVPAAGEHVFPTLIKNIRIAVGQPDRDALATILQDDVVSTVAVEIA